jgi:tetratricopeptide (TPR) repeat protein
VGGDAITAPLTLFFKAMCHHQLGNFERDTLFLERGIAAMETKGVRAIVGPPLADRFPDRWIVWCITEVACREAAELIVGTDDPATLENLGSLDQLAARVKTMTQAIAQAPDNASLLVLRGELLARLSRWDEAARDYVKTAQLCPELDWPWAWAASLLVLAGDTEAYRAHCRAMLEQFAGREEPSTVSNLVTACLLLPDTVEISELPVATLEKQLEGGTRSTAFYALAHVCPALAAYRAGDPQTALNWLGKSKVASSAAGPQQTTWAPVYASHPHLQALAQLIEAMVCHQMNQPREAAQSLAEANQLIETHFPRLSSGRLGNAWPHWLIAEILRREAVDKTTDPQPSIPEATVK